MRRRCETKSVGLQAKAADEAKDFVFKGARRDCWLDRQGTYANKDREEVVKQRRCVEGLM
jgi:hypothetical protein